ncbi:hemagglutination activity protein [Marinosulfonomonas sp. PRT-SC04]|nr:hemagglutination activity protein [Marinosulfonomonas sp. PRT-SC04]
MPDLGKYQTEVLASYAVTLLLLLTLLALSWIKGWRVARALREVEDRRVKNG